MSFLVRLCWSEYCSIKVLSTGNTVSLTWKVTVSKGGSSMLCMCSTSPSSAEKTRDESKEVIFGQNFGFNVGEGCGTLKEAAQPPVVRVRRWAAPQHAVCSVQHRTWLKSTTIKRGQSQERGSKVPLCFHCVFTVELYKPLTFRWLDLEKMKNIHQTIIPNGCIFLEYKPFVTPKRFHCRK